MDNKTTNKNKKNLFDMKKIPIVAFIFPPIGILLLIKYLLNKNKKGL